MDSAADGAVTSKFDKPVRTWRDIPGWFQWRRHQEEAAAHFPAGSRFVEVGCYLGRSICSLGEVVREAGLDSCAQECWARYYRTITRFFAIPEGQMLFCGMAIGHADPEHSANRLRTPRAPRGEYLTVHG